MKTVIFDLDGTLCDITHRLPHIKREKPDWDAFHLACVNDEPKPDTIAVFKALAAQGHTMMIVSGRNNTVKAETVQWLANNDLYPSTVVMRQAKDFTPDDELKESWLLDGTLGPKENILCVFDDRQRVVDMWRRNGLTCLQVDAWAE